MPQRLSKTKQTCGSATIEYDPRCTFICACQTGSPCEWKVSCPDGQGGTLDTSGTGITAHPPKRPTVTVVGNLQTLARMLEKVWKRPVFVPVGLLDKTVRERTLSGTLEEIARGLGLQLGSTGRT